MKRIDLNGLLKSAGRALDRNSPAILTGVGIAGMIGAIILAVKATPKAVKRLDDKKRLEKKDKLTAVETVKTAGTCYIPTAVTTALSAACLIGANTVNGKRSAALATAYSLSESAFKSYREKAVETIGEKKETAVRDLVAKERVEKNPVENREVIVTGKGSTLCYDTISGRYFKSDIETIRKAVNEVNRRLFGEMYISLNEYYDEIMLPQIAIGNDLGWNVEHDYMDVSFSAQLTEAGEPCIVVDYVVAPKYDYR